MSGGGKILLKTRPPQAWLLSVFLGRALGAPSRH